MDLIRITEEYYDFVRNLRTHPENAPHFIEQVTITEEQQKKYMSVHGDNYYIALDEDVALGYVGVIGDDIRICTDPAHKGTGVGKFMLTEIKRLYPKASGKIKANNVVSRKLFDSCKVRYELI